MVLQRLAIRADSQASLGARLGIHQVSFVLGFVYPPNNRKTQKCFMKVCERGEELTRDLFISVQDICNFVGHLAIKTYKCNNNDAKSVCMWVQEYPFLLFYYKESGVHVCGAITCDNIPFTICIQSSWQQDMMLKHGHKKCISIDATFAINENKICCYHRPMLYTMSPLSSLPEIFWFFSQIVTCCFPSFCIFRCTP